MTAFWVLETEVTYKLWVAVYNWAVKGHGYSFANAGRQGGAPALGPVGTNQDPVTTINWRDAMVWTNALTEYFAQEKRLPLECVYQDDLGQVIRNAADTNGYQCDEAFAAPEADGFRLPTHPEWECAARWQGNEPACEAVLERGGLYWTPGYYVSGATADTNNPAATQAACWYSMNSGSSTHAIGAKPVNGKALGLCETRAPRTHGRAASYYLRPACGNPYLFSSVEALCYRLICLCET